MNGSPTVKALQAGTLILIAQLSADLSSRAPAWYLASGDSLYLSATLMGHQGSVSLTSTPARGFERGNALYWPAAASVGGASLGARLRALRAKIIASGLPMLDQDGLAQELADRRAERA